MARINLLPWREAERQRRLQELIAMAIAGVIFTVLIGVGVHLTIEQAIAAQESRNAYLQKEIKELDKQIRQIKDLEAKKASLLARMKVIESLQKSRPEIVHLFDELVLTIPDGIYLSSVQQRGRNITIEGHAQSNARVSAFMRNIEKSAWVGAPSLRVIQNRAKTGTGLSNFQMQFKQVEITDKDSDKDAESSKKKR